MKKMIPPLALVLIGSLLLSLCGLSGFAYAGDESGLAGEENTGFTAGNSGDPAEPPGTDASTATGDPEDAAPLGAVEEPTLQVLPLSSGGTIHGRVTDAVTGEGLGDIWIAIYNEDYWEDTYTDEEGYYTLDVVAGAGYEIMVSGYNAGYANAYLENITVDEDAVLEYDFALLKESLISGRVTDACTGAGIEGIAIMAWVLSSGYITETDQDGYYSLVIPPRNNYTLRAMGREHGYADGYYYDINLAEGAELEFDFVLEPLPMGTIYGKVTDFATGEGIAGVPVRAEGGGDWRIAYTDDRGDYRLALIADTGYTISAEGRDAGYFSDCCHGVLVREGETQEYDFSLHKLPLATIFGRVTDAVTGKGIAGVQVMVDSMDDWIEAYTDEEGDYNFNVIAGINYSMSVRGQDVGYSNDRLNRIRVDAGETAERNFELDELLYGTLSGRVMDSCGEGLAGVWVHVNSGDHAYHFYALTDSNGDYSLRVAEGAGYTVEVNGEDAGYSSSYLDGITIGEGDTLEYDFTLEALLYGTISGRVTDSSTGKGIGDIWVYLWSDDTIYRTTTDGSGYYCQQVAAGMEYTVMVLGNEAGYSNAELCDIRVEEDDALEYDFALDEIVFGTITGKVTDVVTGEGIFGVWVTLFSEEYSFSTRTDAGGEFLLQAAEGTGYTIEIWGWDMGYGSAHAQDVTVIAGETGEFNFQICPLRYGTISGSVTGPEGEPIKHASVEASGWSLEGGYFWDHTLTDRDGHYYMELAADVVYSLTVLGIDQGYSQEQVQGIVVFENENTLVNFRLAYLETAAEEAVAISEAETAAPFSGEGTVQQVMMAESNWWEADHLVSYLRPGFLKDELQARLDAVRQLIDTRAAQLADEAESAVAAAEELTAEPFPSQGTAEEVAGAYRLVGEYYDFIHSFVENLIERLIALLQRITDRYIGLLLESGQPLQMIWNDSAGMYEGRLNFADDTITILVSSAEPVEGVILALLKAGATIAPPAPANLVPADIYLDIKALEGSLEGADLRIETAYDPAAVDEEKLRLYRFSDHGLWEPLPLQGVDAGNCIIWGELTGGFSIFGVFEFNFDFGDINGDGEVNVGDAILLLKHLAGRAVLTGDQQAAADVNSDGKVNVVDAVLILRRAAGLIPGFAGQ